MSIGLSVHLAQRLALTPQLAQSLKILAMSHLDVSQYIDQLLMSNPLLSLEDDYADIEVSLDEGLAPAESAERLSYDDLNIRHTAMAEDDGLSRVPDCPDVWASLHAQVDAEADHEEDRRLAHALLSVLDEDGYFREDMALLAKQWQVKTSAIEYVLLHIVQACEPAGIGARDARECLLLQLDGSCQEDALARRLLLHADSADLLAVSVSKLAKVLAVSVVDVQAALARLRRLDLFPGHDVQGQQAYLKPEVFFFLDAGKVCYRVQDCFSRALSYHNPYENKSFKGKDLDYMRYASQEAKGLLSALDQRLQTLERLAACLAECQAAYIHSGVLAKLPLTLFDVAERLSVHESTISRAVSGKYAQTPWGVVPLKQFFSAGLASKTGAMVSVCRVKELIRLLIQGESCKRPISDQALADRLEQQGVFIARRTVAKYREALGIPASGKRRKR